MMAGIRPYSAKASADPLIGEIIMFAGNFAPRGWAFCDGQLLAISENSALFSILGTTYGGDGRTTFALPDLRGRVPISVGQGPGLSNRALGSKGGLENVTLSINQMPSHNHAVGVTTSAYSQEGDSASPQGNISAKSGDGRPAYYTGSADTNMSTNNVQVTLNPAGGGQSHTIMQPYTTVHYIIALVGTYPSRN